MLKSLRFGLILLFVWMLGVTVYNQTLTAAPIATVRDNSGRLLNPQAPGPALMTLLATGLFAAAGTDLLRSRRKRTGASDNDIEACLELIRLDPRCAWAYSEVKKALEHGTR
jgi:hypothetical protein